jgi:hypothetical protein
LILFPLWNHRLFMHLASDGDTAPVSQFGSA